LSGSRNLENGEGLALRAGLPVRAWHRLRLGGDAGSSTIETAISLSVLFSLTFWLVEMSLFVYTIAVLDDAAHQGVRYAIAHGTDSSSCSGPTTGCGDSTGANVTAVVKAVSAYSLHKISGMTVTVTYPDATGSKAGSLVKVAISYPYVPFIKMLGFNQTTTVSAEGRIVY